MKLGRIRRDEPGRQGRPPRRGPSRRGPRGRSRDRRAAAPAARRCHDGPLRGGSRRRCFPRACPRRSRPGPASSKPPSAPTPRPPTRPRCRSPTSNGPRRWTRPVIRDSLTFPLHMKQYGERLGVGPPNPQFFKTPGYFKGSTGVVFGHDEDHPLPRVRRADRLRARARIRRRRRGPQPDPRAGGRPAVRPDDLQRLLGARHPGARDGHGDGSAEVQGLRLRHRAVDHDDRRSRTCRRSTSSRCACASTARNGRPASARG